MSFLIAVEPFPNELGCILRCRKSSLLSARRQLQHFLLFRAKSVIVFEFALVAVPASVFTIVKEVAMDLREVVVIEP